MNHYTLVRANAQYEFLLDVRIYSKFFFNQASGYHEPYTQRVKRTSVACYCGYRKYATK